MGAVGRPGHRWEGVRARDELPIRGYGRGGVADPGRGDEALAEPVLAPLPFCEFTLKLHGRCNLACDYCYMYEMVDQSWRQKRW